LSEGLGHGDPRHARHLCQLTVGQIHGLQGHGEAQRGAPVRGPVEVEAASVRGELEPDEARERREGRRRGGTFA
jgi:hypothetical protein